MRYLFALVIALGGAPAEATIFTVTKTSDTADGTCDADCSLREAVVAANAASGDDEVVLPAGTFELTRADGSGAPFGALMVDDTNGGTEETLTIRGAGREDTVIHQSVASTGVIEADTVSMFILRDVTVSGGLGGDGAGLQTFVNTLIERVIFATNRSNDDGGAIQSFALLEVNDSVFSENSASDQGGAIVSAGGTTITDTVFRDNISFGTGGALAPTGVLVLERVTFVNNRAASNGGAISAHGPVIATNSTFSFNEAGVVFPASAGVAPAAVLSGAGGAIYAEAPVRLVHCTLTGNVADDEGGAILNAWRNVAPVSVSGGVELPTAVELEATIVADNTPDDCDDDPFGTAVTPQVSLGYVLDSDGSCVSGAGGDLTDADPGLEPLADNGGATPTHALAADSPAVDAGSNVCAAEVDQREVTRPQDGDGDGSVLCDIGAFEAGAATTTTTTTPGGTTTTTTLPGGCEADASFSSILCRLDALVTLTNESSGLGKQQQKLQKTLARADGLTNLARNTCDEGARNAEKNTGRALKKARRKLLGYRRGFTSHRARKQIEESVREAFLGLVEPLIDDVKTLRGSVVCPDDATPEVTLQPSR